MAKLKEDSQSPPQEVDRSSSTVPIIWQPPPAALNPHQGKLGRIDQQRCWV
jgi:hypothetical protein